MIERIDHVNLVVDDLDTMARFYCDVLGMSASDGEPVTISGDWIDATAGLSGIEADVIHLWPNEGPGVELIRYRTPPGASPRDLGVPNTKGLRHFALRVRDIDATVDRLHRAGVKFVSSIRQVPTTQVQHAGGVRKKIVYFHDPEGNLVELCSYAAGQ